MLALVREWLSSKLFSVDRVERHFAAFVIFLLSLTFCFIAFKPIGVGAPLATFWALLVITVVLFGVWAEQNDSRWKYLELSRLGIFLLMLISVPVYYDAANVVNRYRYARVGSDGSKFLFDEIFLHWDSFLLGWIFPYGQLSLYLDTQPNFGVTSWIGRVYTEILQVMYVSYYFWGNGIAVWWGYRYFFDGVYKQSSKPHIRRQHWRRLQMMLSAWCGAFFLTFTFNLFLPAVSPRIYLEGAYRNEVHGLFLADKLRGAVQSAASNTFSAFPSGHCGLSWMAAVVAYRAKMKHMFIPTSVAAVLISIATIVLRYHYFVDFLFGFWLVIFGAWFGGFHNEELFQKLLTQKTTTNIYEMNINADEIEIVKKLEEGMGDLRNNNGDSVLPTKERNDEDINGGNGLTLSEQDVVNAIAVAIKAEKAV